MQIYEKLTEVPNFSELFMTKGGMNDRDGTTVSLLVDWRIESKSPSHDSFIYRPISENNVLNLRKTIHSIVNVAPD